MAYPEFNSNGQMISQNQKLNNSNLIFDANRQCYIDRLTNAMFDLNGNPIMQTNNQTADGYNAQQDNQQWVYDSFRNCYVNKYTGELYGGNQNTNTCATIQHNQYPHIPKNTGSVIMQSNAENVMANTYTSKNKNKKHTLVTEEPVKKDVVNLLPLPGNEYPPFLPDGLYSEKVIKGGYYEYKIKGECMTLDIDIDRDYKEVSIEDNIESASDLHTSKVVAKLIYTAINTNKHILETNVDMLHYIVLDSKDDRDDIITILRDSVNPDEVMNKLVSLNTMTNTLKPLDDILTKITNDLFEYVFYLSAVSSSFIDDYYDIKKLIYESDDYDTRVNGKLVLDYIVNDIIGNMVKSKYQLEDSSILTISIPTKIIYIDYEDITRTIDRISDEVCCDKQTARIYGLTKRIKELYNNLSRLNIKYSGTIIVTKKSTVSFYKNVNDSLLLVF